ncbi:isopeptide-forming domain-containing fimbrial protein [Acinetobacter baumannii]|uniref:isopeptide-forming domain-containing fimbrial protein n=1 Tax=Acinetobacter baumannii TaxID=470 RepID=UPI000D647917|nr:isopeptide-forming domain-containing fimbrial protein [Acinetobacter baumannii]MCT9272115.1 isopeptide-forming domain-containing fimbrial protein [Acinetobacter baumannii]MCW8772395.1 isopeptide-forming domain-containing fimbrial protein [Acinetobacter baumannii]MDA3517266.1 isopeptide-forming domain-containing fimbrial protein [Acinetobacter baumannii]MDA3562492.1 isopeptide-forming domain-containing fimbrial protein [Acinetobacter baumannii]MDC4962300.1 isopeptide-forming domain-containin
MKMINTLNNNRPKLFNWVLTLLCVLTVQQSAWAATNSIISNMAVGEYSEEGSTVVQVARSNLVQTTILPVYSLNLVAANNKTVVAGQTVYFNHILTNTSNETDQYTFTVSNNPTGDDFDFVNSSLMVYLDANNDGIPDGSAITGYTLGAGQSVGLIVAASIPNTITTGKVANLTLMVTSANGASGTNSNVDKATVTDQSTLVVRKKFSQITAANGDVVTIRLDYQNPTNTIVPTATLTDTLGSNLTYEVNTGKWNGVTVYDAVGGTADPTGINYSVTSNVVTATLTNIPANTIGYIEFNVKINKSIAGKIENVINVTGLTTDTSNTAVVNVAPVYAVKMNGSASNVSDNTNTITASAVPQGGELKFTNYVWNIGNTTDRFNLTLTNSTFPTGSQIEFYRADGVTPLLDSNGDGIPDTGLLSAGVNLPIVVKVRLPSSYAVTTDTTFEVSPQAQSLGDISKTSLIKDQGNLLATTVARLVDLTNSPENNGLGNGNVNNAGNPWKTVIAATSTNPVASGQAIFPLKVSHTGIGTEYLLSANSTSNFTSLTLPNGVNRVRFYVSGNGSNCNVMGSETGKTIYLNNGESQLICAVVEVDQLNSSVTTPIYFRALSTSFVSGNNSSNPSQDIIMDAITIQSVNSVAKVEFTPNFRGQVSPLGTVIYSHLLINNTDVDYTGNYSFLSNNDQVEFNSTLFYDVNGNGVFDAGDLVMRSLADLPGGKLAAHTQVKLLLQVKNLVANNIAQANTTTINLTNNANGQVLASITDVTTVNQRQLKLSKLQARDFDCNGTADESYTTNSLNIGKQANGQGQCVLYKVILTNTSATAMSTAFTFRDMTPAYTVLSQSPICTSCSGMTAPTVGNAGAVSGTLNSVAANQSYEFNFGVRYVGQ